VWVQGSVLYYCTPARGTGRLPIDSIDRPATLQLNAEKHIDLWLAGD
jgi:hypothetical protein